MSNNKSADSKAKNYIVAPGCRVFDEEGRKTSAQTVKLSAAKLKPLLDSGKVIEAK